VVRRGAAVVTTIERVHGRRVWDSRGRPTVEAVDAARGRSVEARDHREQRRLPRAVRPGDDGDGRRPDLD
jgi:hypothetical protein